MEKKILDSLLSLGEKREFELGETIFQEGSPSETFGYVLKGKVGVEKQVNPQEYISILTIPAGEFFGEMVLFEKGRRLTRVRSLTSSEIVFISREKFFYFLNQKPREGLDIFIFIMKKVLKRISHTNKEMSCLYQLSFILTKIDEVREFISAVARIVGNTFDFPGVVAYFFNNIVQEYEIIYKEGVAPHIDIKKIASAHSLGEGVLGSDVSEISNTDLQKNVLFFPLMSPYGLAGSILFFKEKKFTDNEKSFLRMILIQTNSFLEIFFFRKAEKNQKRLKRNHFRF